MSIFRWEETGRAAPDLYQSDAALLGERLWHGAAWTFVIWGALHGLVSVFERIFHKQLDKLPRILRVTGTFLFVNGGLGAVPCRFPERRAGAASGDVPACLF